MLLQASMRALCLCRPSSLDFTNRPLHVALLPAASYANAAHMFNATSIWMGVYGRLAAAPV
jgi:hypothetical protein